MRCLIDWKLPIFIMIYKCFNRDFGFYQKLQVILRTQLNILNLLGHPFYLKVYFKFLL